MLTRMRAPLTAWLLALPMPMSGLSAGVPADPAPLSIARQGTFMAGGKVIGEAGVRSLSCDHGYVEYQIPTRARRTALLLWHSSSAAVWQRRWDGGEGFQSIMLRRRFPVYLWDGPRVGRANWGCEDYVAKPVFGRDEQNFISWRFGAKYPEWFPGVQFPKDLPEAWEQAVRARYQEFDTVENAELQSDAAAKAVDKIGPAVLVTNSAGGLRAMLTAMKSGNVKAIVAYETPGVVFPEGEGPDAPPGPFGPIKVPLAEFKKLTKIPIQLVFGDNIQKSERWMATFKRNQQFADVVNRHGGRAEVLALPMVGVRGNTHIPFADLNNVEVADQLSLFLKRNKLDGQ